MKITLLFLYYFNNKNRLIVHLVEDPPRSAGLPILDRKAARSLSFLNLIGV